MKARAQLARVPKTCLDASGCTMGDRTRSRRITQPLTRAHELSNLPKTNVLFFIAYLYPCYNHCVLKYIIFPVHSLSIMSFIA